MAIAYIILIVASLLVGMAALTGWWRSALRPLRLNASKMTVESLGLSFTAAEDVKRVNAIFKSFCGGFNAMISRPSSTAWRRYAKALSPQNQPFAHEGAAMGYALRHLGPFSAEDFERRFVQEHAGFRYLYYVGQGFWWGMRNRTPAWVEGAAADLDPLLGNLVFDGYGFKHAFFDYPTNPAILGKLDQFRGYARNTAYQGVGRAFWFRFMPRHDDLIHRIGSLGAFAGDAAAGAGLAAVFVNPDRLDTACDLGADLPEAWHDQFQLGMCFGLKARSLNHPGQFERDLSMSSEARRESIAASIDACDRIEALVRSNKQDYCQWRTLVAEWMRQHIQYPLAGVRKEQTTLMGGFDKTDASHVAQERKTRP